MKFLVLVFVFSFSYQEWEFYPESANTLSKVKKCEKIDEMTSGCQNEYFNLNVINNIEINMSPIKSGASTLSFWFFLLSSTPDNKGVIHFVVQDYFVASIFIDTNLNYNFCITIHQMYHKTYGKEIETLTDRDDFINTITQFPYKNWFGSLQVSEKDIWIYCRFGFNTHINQANIFLSHLNKEDTKKILKNEEFNLNSEFIYNNDKVQSDIHYKRYYRQNEQVRFGIYGLHSFINERTETQIYLKSLYIFSTYIPATKITTGFQYIQFEKKIALQPEDFPELIFSLPLDLIDYDVNRYIIYYSNPIGYLRPHFIISENADDKMYSYPNSLYKLELIVKNNTKYDKNNKTADIECKSPNFRCYDDNRPYICEEKHYTKFGEKCLDFTNHPCDNNQTIGKGLSTSKKGLCLTTCNGECSNNLNTELKTQCPDTSFPLYEDCKNKTTSGSIYYSYFYNLPPMKIKLNNNFLSSFYIQFDFLYETNKVIRHDNSNLGFKFKDKKIYILITDSFRIWHDYRMTYIGIEDNNGHISQNIRPFFNLDNYNQFTISVDFVNKVYRGRMYINSNKANLLTFSGNQLTYILFCHLDDNCELGNKIHWTSGYYKKIRVWDKTNNEYINDYMIYNSYIIDSYYNYIRVKNNSDLVYMNQEYTTTLPLNLQSINNNYLSVVENSSLIYDINNNPKSNFNQEFFQLYNFNDKQELYTRGNINTYINENSEEQICNSKCTTCYGGGNPFSEECNTCNSENSYYINSNCKVFPTKNKDYYALIIPSIDNEEIEIPIEPIEDRITITFWMKLLGFKENKGKFNLVSLGNITMSYSSKYSVLKFKYKKEKLASINYRNYLGKYIHISLSYFKFYEKEPHKNNPPFLHVEDHHKNKKYYLSIQVNREDLSIRNNLDNYFFNKIIFHKDYYATFTKFYIYDRVIIGGYAYNTNSFFDSDVPILLKIIDESIENCLYHKANKEVVCIHDYDIAFNKDYYLNIASPGKMLVYLTENESYKIEKCSSKCGTFCYGTTDSSCSCTSDSAFNYLIKEDNKVKCQKLHYIDINRLKTFEINNINCEGITDKGTLSFWHYMVNTTNSRIIYMFVDEKKQKTYKFNFLNKKEQIQEWKLSTLNEIDCSSKFHLEIDGLTNQEDNKSIGLLHLRQIRFWFGTPNKYNISFKKIGKTISNYHGLLFSIDSLIDSSYTFQSYPSHINIVSQLKEIGNYNFSYYPLEQKIPVLNLCEEDEDCVKIIRLNKMKPITNDSFLFSFNKIYPSVNSRYSIETWIKIENPEQFLHGINLIWEKHISLSILTDAQTNQVNYICFPQDYLSSPKKLGGRHIFNKAESALNVDRFTYDSNSIDNKWVFIRCAYHWDNEKFYIRNEDTVQGTEKKVNKEHTYPGMEVDYPFKFLFNDYEYSTFIIEYNKTDEDVDVLISTIRLYNEYLPPTFPSIRIAFKKNSFISSLKFSVDFSDYTSDLKALNIINELKNQTEIQFESTKYYDKDNDNNDNLIRGKVMLCESGEYYNMMTMRCENCTNVPTKGINYNCEPLECDNNFFLNLKSYTCTNSGYLSLGNRITRAPGSNESTALLNYECSSNHVGCNFVDNFPEKLICNPGFVRVGYKCFPSSSQETAAFYFNRCYNFFPIYKRVDKILTQIKEGYALEFAFKFDKVNEFCNNDIERYVFWAYPHLFYQKAGSDDVYYKDGKINMEPIHLSRISLYEWNYVIIRYQDNEVSIFINLKMNGPEISYSTTNYSDYNITAIAFCNGKHQCEPLGKQLEIQWTSAYYSHIRIYNLKATNIYAVYEYALKRVQSLTTSILVYYLFNNIHNDLNEVYNEVDPEDEELKLNFNLNIPINSGYRTTDHVLMYSSSANFDWGEKNKGNYVTSVEQFTGKVTFSSCSPNCSRCYDEKSNNCYQCREGYTLYNNECRVSTGYYMQMPENLGTDLTVNFANDNFDITLYNPITITIWMKFFGIKRDLSIPSQNPDNNCILLIRISVIDKTFLCYNLETNTITLYYNLNTILYDNSSFMKISGAWALVSFSNYNSKNTSPYYPNIFSFAFNGNTVKRQNTYNIPSPGLSIDTLIFGNGISGSIADIRIYKTFIMNPYGIIINSESTTKYLIYNKLLYSNTQVQCVSAKDFDINISATGLVKCYEDYNLYHDKSINCNNEPNSMLTTVGCKNCIEECSYCGGESKLNCACYYNSYYWFRKDKITNQVYCQRLPYHDFNIYSQAEFSNLEVANTNEYAIEFWYFIYEYDKNNILFNFQEIKWTNHIKIQIYNENGKLMVDCYPLSDKTLKVRDDSHSFFKWNHVVCGANLKSRKYYLNNLGINKINEDNIIMLDTLQGKSKLSFINENGSSGVTSHGAFLIKEMKLWSIFSIREFPTDCVYQATDASSVPYLLHYFPLTVPINGDLVDSQGNKASSLTKKHNIIGYNLVDYYNLYNIDETLEKCLLIFTIPSMGYYNLTNFLIQVRDNIPNLISYEYNYYISEEGEKNYNQINQEVLVANSIEKEYLLEKLTDEKYKDSQLNIYVKAKDANSKVYIGFGRIEVINYGKGKDVDYIKYTIGIEDPITHSSVSLTNNQIWNRLYVLSSLGDLYNSARKANNMTLSLKDYYTNKINLYNPECSEDFCSYQGKCYVVVRSLGCLCNYGYTGANCHMTNNNNEYLTQVYIEYWNLLTKNSNFGELVLNDEKLNQILYLVKAASSFIDVTSNFITNFFNLVNYLQINKISLYISNYDYLFETFNYILFSLYNSINSGRINKYNETLYSTEILSPLHRRLSIQSDETILPYTNLSFQNEYLYKTVGTTLISSMSNLVLSLIKNTRLDYELNFISFDLTIKSIDSTFDYESYFTQRKSLYKSYFDGSECQQYIFSSASHAKLFLVIIEYKYNPLSYHFLYSNSTSYLNDVFFSTPLGTKVDIISCPNTMSIYFPINLYDKSKLEFITEFQSSYQTMTEGKYNKKDPYVTYPSYVFDNGVVSRKTRLQRINEWSPRFMLNCSYFDINLKDFSQVKNISVSEDYYIRCRTKHLSIFTTEGFDNPEEFPIAGLFFYLKCPQVLKCGSNYKNVCFIFYVILLVAFIGGEIAIFFLDHKTIKEANILDNIKMEIIKENRMVYTEEEITAELKEINKLNNQNVLEREIGIQQSCQSSMINIIKQKEKQPISIINPILFKGNPPKKIKQNVENNYINEIEEENENSQPRYKDEESEQNSYNDYYFEDMNYEFDKHTTVNNKKDEKSSITHPTKLALKDQDEYGVQFKNADLTEIEAPISNESQVKNEEEAPVDYFVRYATSTERKMMNNNFTLPEKDKKVTFVNEIDSLKNIPSFYEDIDNKNPDWKIFFLYLSLRRNVYLSPFTLSSTLNPRWKRMFILYIYILLQFFYITIFLTIVERTNLPKGGKVIIFSIINLVAANITIYPITFLFKVSENVKFRLFELLKSSSQMKLILEWKLMKKRERKKFIWGILVFICVFFLGFFFSFQFCSVLYGSKGIYISTFILSLLTDLFAYESFLNGLLTLFYYKRKYKESYNKHYYRLFKLRNYRCCV